MSLILLLLNCFVYSLGQDENSSDNFYLEVFSIPAQNENKLTARVGGSINVTCKIISNVGDRLPEFSMTWHTPQTSNSMNRIYDNRRENMLSLSIHNLVEKDSGDYRCEAGLENDARTILQKTLHVTVKKKTCGPLMFDCSETCIGRRFVCDGRKDCRDGSDEFEEECGPYPCREKLQCDDGRCIPMNWCCDQFHSLFHNPNCSTVMKLQCCQQLLNFRNSDPNFVADQQRSSDVGFLQTTVYTVIGCAVVFTSIVTILAISICRIHMNRTASHCSSSQRPMSSPSLENRTTVHHHALQHVPLYDLDVFSAPSDANSGRSGFLVAYNINNGVQFVGHPIEPPPYSEVAEPPPKEGPPPPYASREDINSTRVDIAGFSQEDTFSVDEGIGEQPSRNCTRPEQVQTGFHCMNINCEKQSDESDALVASSSDRMFSAADSHMLDSDPLILNSAVCATHGGNHENCDESCHLQEIVTD